jgi:hypothetical protein
VRIDDIAVVCRIPECHGRIIPDGVGFAQGRCAKCGLHTDEFLRRYRTVDWEIVQRLRASEHLLEPR